MPDPVHTLADVQTQLAQLRTQYTAARKHNPQRLPEIRRLIDKWLDESLDIQGAHPATCPCRACRSLGELTNPDDVAIEGRW